MDDEDDEMDMEEGEGGSSSAMVERLQEGEGGSSSAMEGEGGSSSGVISYQVFPFKSNGDQYVQSVRANGKDELKIFTADQKEEMEQYIQTLRSLAVSSSGAAGGSASNSDDEGGSGFEGGMSQALDLARMFSAECNKLRARNAKLERKAKRPQGKRMEAMAVRSVSFVVWIE